MKNRDLRLLLSFGSSRNLIYTTIGASIVWSAIIIANAFLIGSIIIGIIGRSTDVPRLIFLLAALWVFRTIFQSQFERWSSEKAVEVKAELRQQVIQKMDEVETHSPTFLSTLLIKGLNSLDLFIGRFIPQMILATAIPVTVIATLFFLDKRSAFIAIATLPLIPLFGALIGKYTADGVMKKWRELGSLSKYFEDSMRGFVTLKIYGRHRSQAQRISEMGKRYTDETMKVLIISFLSSLVLELCATISVALMAVSIGIRLVDGSIAFLPSLVILILAPEVYFPLRNAATLFHASVDGAEALRQVRELLDTSHDQEVLRSTQLTWERWSSSELSISVPARTVAPGERIVLVGESGIGKTTFINHLITRLEIDRLAWIPQSPHLAQGSLREQITLVNPTMTDEQIIALFQRVGLDLSDFNAGLETTIGGTGEKSSHASGGQIRKIAIARALAKNASIVIADEPTADLDAKSVERVESIFKELAESGTTLLIVTHDEVLMRSATEVISVVRDVA